MFSVSHQVRALEALRVPSLLRSAYLVIERRLVVCVKIESQKRHSTYSQADIKR